MNMRWLVPGIPFAVSLLLSLSTVGNTVFWQDSGLFLVALREMSVLYPPGSVLYLVLCKLWTVALFFVDFTLAVHLFSSLCAALAAAALAVGSRALLRARGPLFRVTEGEPSPMSEWAGLVAGCLAAGGYAFWFSGIYAKSYSLFYLVLSLLLWRMIRADESRRPGDFTKVAALIGLTWAAHPSAANAGLALILFVAFHATTLGWKGVAWRIGLAAICAGGLSVVLLPILSARESITAMGDPRTPSALLDYLLGTRYLGASYVFGLEPSRCASLGRYFWEEFLGVGLLALITGLVRLARVNRRLLLGVASWIVPFLAITVLFKLEGQHDHWFIGGWMPLYLVAGLGLFEIGRWMPVQATRVIAALGTAGMLWAVAFNRPALNLRGYDLAERYGRFFLDPVHALHPGCIVVTTTDDTLAICQYLQRVKGEYPGVRIVNGTELEEGATGRPSWYDRRLLKEDATLRMPDYGETRRRVPPRPGYGHSLAAFANANAGNPRGIFFEEAPPGDMIRGDFTFVPAGALWKLVAREDARGIDRRYWDFQISPEEVRARYRRERAQRTRFVGGVFTVRPEPYERRLMAVLLAAQARLGDWYHQHGDYREAKELYESVLRNDPESYQGSPVIYLLGTCYFRLQDYPRAEPLLLGSLAPHFNPKIRAHAHVSLGKIYSSWGRSSEAQSHLAEAFLIPSLDPSFRRELEQRARSLQHSPK